MNAQLEIDMYIDVEPNGMSYGLYFGDSCEPACQNVESWEEIVERNIGYYLVPGSNTFRPYDVEQLEKNIAGLEHAIALFREKIEQHKE